MRQITVACLDMAGTTVADDGCVLAAFLAAVAEFGWRVELLAADAVEPFVMPAVKIACRGSGGPA